MKKRLLYDIVVIALAVAYLSLSVGFTFGYNLAYGGITKESPEIMNRDDAILYLKQAEYSHQFYINYPELQTDRTGDTEFNQLTVRKYRAIINLLLSEQEGMR